MINKKHKEHEKNLKTIREISEDIKSLTNKLDRWSELNNENCSQYKENNDDRRKQH